MHYKPRIHHDPRILQPLVPRHSNVVAKTALHYATKHTRPLQNLIVHESLLVPAELAKERGFVRWQEVEFGRYVKLWTMGGGLQLEAFEIRGVA